MKQSLSKMKIYELRELAVSLGVNRNETYGTSKQALILKIGDARRAQK